MQQRSTIPPICPRNSRRLYVEARKGGWFRTLFCAVSLLAFHRSARNRMFPLRVRYFYLPMPSSLFRRCTLLLFCNLELVLCYLRELSTIYGILKKRILPRGFYLIFLLDEIYWKRESNFLDLIFQNCVRNAVSFPRNSPRIIRGPGILRLWKGIKISVTHCKVSVRSVKETRR